MNGHGGLALALALAALPGCSEYDLKGAADDGDPPISSSTETVAQDCPTDPAPGFDAAYDEDCLTAVATGSFTPVVEWTMQAFAMGPSGNEVMSMPIVVPLTDDDSDGLVDDSDVPDIVFVAYDRYTGAGVLRAVSGDGSGELWATSVPSLQPQGGVAGGDLDGDGTIELVVSTYTGVAAVSHTGQLEWTSANVSGHLYGTSDVPAISDMDHDGSPEIVIGRAILRSDGTLRGTGAHGMGGVAGQNVGTCAFAVDLDDDGVEEVITGNAVYAPDGTALWHNGLQDGYPAVADFDGDGRGEIAVSGQGNLRLLDTNGTQLWSLPIPGAGSSYYGGPPTIADFDGDGAPEIGVAAGSRYSVIEADGTLLWQAVTNDSSSGNTGSAVFDFEGDGAAEVVYADQTRLWVFSGVDGSVKLESAEHSNGTWLEYSVIADVDGDDQAEIVVPNEYQNGGYSGITVFGDLDESWRPGRRIWNQHAYHITNVNDDGSIPARADLNWATYNNFRSGDMSAGDGLAAPDLLLADGGLCEIDCDEGRLVVQVHAGNEGAASVLAAEGTVLELHAWTAGVPTLLDEVVVGADVPQGVFLDAVVFDLVGDPASWESLEVRIHSDALECDPDDNTLFFHGPFCGA